LGVAPLSGEIWGMLIFMCIGVGVGNGVLMVCYVSISKFQWEFALSSFRKNRKRFEVFSNISWKNELHAQRPMNNERNEHLIAVYECNGR